MVARTATWIAIAIGGTGGTLAAVVNSGMPAVSPARSSGLPMRPLGAIVAEVPGATPAGPLGATTPVTPTPTPTTTAAEPAAASASAGPAAGERPKPAAPPPAADLLPLPTTKKALLREEMHCDQRKAEACIVAARSFEGGSTGVTDLEKAQKYRRIALTAWISQCDHNSASACATLATMYRAGSGVPQSDRNADALVARARELCRFNDAPACHELPSP